MDEIKTSKNDLASLLRDFAQGASNSVAGNVAVPIDAIAWLLRKGGVNVPPNPVMGSDWMAEKGLTREPQNKLAGFVGDMAGMVAPFAAASKAPQIAKGLLAAGDAMPMGSKGMPALSKASPMADRGAIVWHGSPHKFDAFDASKIGTGEGAQAYGHGLYLADSPTIAKNYQAKVSAMRGTGEPTINGRPINWESPIEAAAFEISRHNGDRIAAHDFYGRNFKNPKTQELILSGNNLPTVDLPGNLYKVDLPDEHIAKMLDWDKPLSQQALDVRTAIRKIKDAQFADDAWTGQQFHDFIGQQAAGIPSWMGVPKPDSANVLREVGIPGIKYLDQGSRTAGQGSSNYVVFPGNERLLKILERNGESVAPKYPQSQALELAQQRAALPVSEGGLGLPANNTAMDRANVMFPIDVYHGGSSDIRAPSYEFSGKGHDQYGSAALYTATNPTLASGYAEKALEGANVMPLRINTKGFVSDTNVPNLTSSQISEMIKKSPDKDAIYNFGDVDYDGLNKVIGNAVKEYKSVSDDGLSQLNMLSNDFYPNNPAEFNKGISKLTGIRGVTADVGAGEKFHMPWHEDDIRSRFAAFDPWRRNAAIAATMGVAAPDLLANPLDDKNNRLIDILRNK
jgi:hypothetical protein